jgi:hypothetical protein
MDINKVQNSFFENYVEFAFRKTDTIFYSPETSSSRFKSHIFDVSVLCSEHIKIFGFMLDSKLFSTARNNVFLDFVHLPVF